jgi:hypothetical protein
MTTPQHIPSLVFAKSPCFMPQLLINVSALSEARFRKSVESGEVLHLSNLVLLYDYYECDAYDSSVATC